MGRPSDFTQEIADLICDRIAEGDSLRKICREDGFPNKSTVFRWLGENSKFRDQYARAHEEQADTLFDDIVAIADDSANDYGFKEGEDKDGDGARPVFLAENVQRSKLRVEARKWAASKLSPKKYGDFQRTELTGKDGGPISISIADQIRSAHGD